MLFCRMRPEITPSTGVAELSNFTRKVALGNMSTISPSIRNASSLANREFYPLESTPTEAAPDLAIGVKHPAHIGIVFNSFGLCVFERRQRRLCQGARHGAFHTVGFVKREVHCALTHEPGEPITHDRTFLI